MEYTVSGLNLCWVMYFGAESLVATSEAHYLFHCWILRNEVNCWIFTADHKHTPALETVSFGRMCVRRDGLGRSKRRNDDSLNIGSVAVKHGGKDPFEVVSAHSLVKLLPLAPCSF